MPLEQKLPEDVTAEGRAYAFKGIGAGLEYAQKARAFKLQEEELAQKQASLEETKKQNQVDILTKVVDTGVKMQKYPTNVRNAMVKEMSSSLSGMGYPMGKAVEEWVKSDESGEVLGKLHSAMALAYEKGDLSAFKEAANGVLTTLGDERGLEAIHQFAERAAKAVNAKESASKQDAIMERMVTGINLREGAKEKRDTRKRNEKYRSDLLSLYTKDGGFNKTDSYFNNVFKEIASDPGLSSGVTRANLAKALQQLNELKLSVVHPSELNSVNVQTLWGQIASLAGLNVSRWNEKEARDAIKFIRTAYDSYKKNKVMTLQQFQEAADSEGVGSILTPKQKKELDMFNSAEVSAEQIAAKKTGIANKIKEYEKKTGKKVPESVVNRLMRGGK